MAHKRTLLLLAAALAIAAASVAVAQASTAARSHHDGGGHGSNGKHGSATATPIKHVVVIFQENESFDHYFGDLSQGRQHRRTAISRRAPDTGGRWSPAGDEPLAAAKAPPQHQPADEQSQREPARAAGQQRHRPARPRRRAAHV